MGGDYFSLLIMLHLYLNRHRLWSLSAKMPLTMRIINRVINAVTFAVILTAIVSGMMLSRHILLDLPFHNPASWVRKVHMTSVHWECSFWRCISGCTGKCWQPFLSAPEHRRRLTLCKCHYAGDFSLIALLGLYWLLNLNYLNYLLMKVDFSFSITTNPLLFYLRYLAIIILFSLMTRFLLWCLIFRQYKALSP